MKRGVPERGDVLHLDLDPIKGREQRGQRFVVVLTELAFNRFGLAMVCPVTQGGEFARVHGFAVSLPADGTKTRGIVLCHQTRSIDYKDRDARWVEPLPREIVEEVLARVRTLLD